MPGLPPASLEKFISSATHEIHDWRWNADVAVL
jgi:hypothetical protein